MYYDSQQKFYELKNKEKTYSFFYVVYCMQMFHCLIHHLPNKTLIPLLKVLPLISVSINARLASRPFDYNQTFWGTDIPRNHKLHSAHCPENFQLLLQTLQLNHVTLASSHLLKHTFQTIYHVSNFFVFLQQFHLISVKSTLKIHSCHLLLNSK